MTPECGDHQTCFLSCQWLTFEGHSTAHHIERQLPWKGETQDKEVCPILRQQVPLQSNSSAAARKTSKLHHSYTTYHSKHDYSALVLRMLGDTHLHAHEQAPSQTLHVTSRNM